MGMQVKSVPFHDVKADMDKRTFEGYAATWDLDQRDDVIVRGAFAKTLIDRGPKPDKSGEIRSRIKVLWQHMSFWPIGIPLEMRETEEGLFVKSRVSKIPKGDEALELMRDGTVDTMSIGYNTVKHEYNEETEIRYLKEIKLFEFSPVTFPANEAAVVTGVKELGEIVLLKQIAGCDPERWAALQDLLKNSSNIEDLKTALTEFTKGQPPLPASDAGEGNTPPNKGEPRSGKDDPGPDFGGLQSFLQALKQDNERWSKPWKSS